MKIHLFVVVLHCLTIVTAQQPVVDKSQVNSGDTFTITCDINRFSNSGLATDAFLTSLTVARKTLTSSSFVTIAIYVPFSAPSGQNITNIPSGRKWFVQFIGGYGVTNRNTIKVIVTVNDAQCSDAGIYICRALFLSDATYYESSWFNLTTLAQVTISPLFVSPNNSVDGELQSNYEAGENISLTCDFKGPPGLTASWMFTSQGTFEQPYPYANEMHDNDPITSTTEGCAKTSYSSVLNFQIQATDDGNMYICTVKNGSTELRRANFSILIKKGVDAGGNSTDINKEVPTIASTKVTVPSEAPSSSCGSIITVLSAMYLRIVSAIVINFWMH